MTRSPGSASLRSTNSAPARELLKSRASAPVSGRYVQHKPWHLSLHISQSGLYSAMSSSTKSYDLIVLGGGPAGENVADIAHKAGLTTAVIELELVGGECSYYACIPSKALLRSGIALRAALAVDGTKQAVTGQLDVKAVLARRNYMTSNWSDEGQASWLKGAGIDLFRGKGRLRGKKVVEVEDGQGKTTTLTAKHAVTISTGSDTLIPDIKGIESVKPWTNREATSAKVVPTSLIIIGGGVVACEMATVYATFGSKVTMLVRGSGLLSGQEDLVGEFVAKSLKKLGTDVRFKTSATSARRNESSGVVVETAEGEIVASEILIATGRTPRTADIGLETVALKSGSWLIVDDTLLVNSTLNDADPWLYAVGDVNKRALLTHQGKYQARAAGDVIAARASGAKISATDAWSQFTATADRESVPQVVFTDPEVASVGLTAEAAKNAGYNVRVVDYELGSVPGAYLLADGYEGRARMVVDEEKKVVLGVTFVGQDVSELVHAATIAVIGQVPISRLWHAVAPFPTMSEIWLRLLETYGRPSPTGA